MTVQELIDELSKHPKDLRVMVNVSSVDGDYSTCVNFEPSFSIDTPCGDWVEGEDGNEQEGYDEDLKVLMFDVESV